MAIDINILFLAMPDLTARLNATAAQQLWISDSYGLVVGVLAIVAGAVGDRFGRRRLLLWGTFGFLLASVLAACAPSAGVLILARVLQGICGATLMPSTLALILQTFPRESERQRAIGLWATCQFAVASLGPVAGGVLLHFFWWGSVFLMAAPVCLVVLMLGPSLLPESQPSRRAPHVDVPSAGLLVATMVGVFTTIKAFVPDSGTPVPVALAAVVLAGGAGVLFIRRQARLGQPFLDVLLLRSREIWGSVLSLTIVGIVLAGTGFWVSQYLQSAVGLDPLHAAIAFLPMGLSIGAGTVLAPRLVRYLDADRLVVAGLVLAALGASLLLTASTTHPLVPVLIGIALTAFGCGPLFAFGTARIVTAAPASASARAAALAETSNHLGSWLGVALVGTLGAAVYTMTAQPLFGDVDPVVPADTMATSRLAAHGVPDSQQILAAITAGGTASLHAVGLASAALLLVCTGIHVIGRRQQNNAKIGHH
ncbi:MAG: MFS transporter [Gordonia sp. (in: high G+C Gram-positive bacteria)]